MIISDLEELRRCFPSHALQSIDPLMGTIDNSEHDFLQEKLGVPLYNKLCEHYKNSVHPLEEDAATSYYNRLLLMSQRAVVFDTFGRCIGAHIISINNAGVNISTADGYQKVDKEIITEFKNTCTKEAHSAINRLLATLEEWVQYVAVSESPDAQLQEIVNLWRKSRYYYLCAELILPSARVLQEYLNIYDSREKFIQMLPDIRYIQEEMLVPAIGEDLTDVLVAESQKRVSPVVIQSQQTEPTEPTTPNTPTPPTKYLSRTIHAARKFMAAALEERTEILRTNANRRAKAHDEQVRLLQSLKEYIASHQSDFLTLNETAMKGSPLYVAPDDNTCCCTDFENNKKGNSIFVTPPLY